MRSQNVCRMFFPHKYTIQRKCQYSNNFLLKYLQNILAPWQSDCAGQGRTQSSGWKQSVAPCNWMNVTVSSWDRHHCLIYCIETWCYRHRWCPWTALYQTHGQALPLSHHLWLPAKLYWNHFVLIKAVLTLFPFWRCLTFATICSASSELSTFNFAAMSANVIRL